MSLGQIFFVFFQGEMLCKEVISILARQLR